jgi:hypothetical protein
MTRRLKSLLALLCALPLAGCYAGQAALEGAAPRFPELALKERLQRASAGSTAPLRLRRSIRQGEGAEFVVPAGIAYSETGDLYISDNNAHTIHLWRGNSAAANELTAATDAARLRFPNPVRAWGGKIFVSDNDGIKVLSSDGSFEKLLRLYLGVFDFALTDRGTIVASLMVRNPEPKDPLVVEIDQTGRVIRRFTARRAAAGQDDHRNQAFVAVSGDRVVVAYKYRPVVEVFDLNSGELVREFEIKHPVFESLKNQPRTETPAGAPAEQKLEPRYAAGVKVLGDSIFLCLHLPVPEVWELDGEGRLRAAFRADGLPSAMNLFGFDARRSDGEVKFAIGVVDTTWGTSISELSTTSS